MRLVIALLGLTLLAGCAANRPQMSRAEYIQTTTRTIPGVTAEEVFAASEQLFRLADGEDFQFYHAENEMMAVRNWSFYLVFAAGFGKDYWTIKAKDVEGGAKVIVAVSTASQSIAPTPTTNGDVSAGTLPAAGGSPVQGTAIYDTYWGRLEHLLGKDTQWVTCREAHKRLGEKTTWGVIEPLCNGLNMANLLPDGRPEREL